MKGGGREEGGEEGEGRGEEGEGRDSHSPSWRRLGPVGAAALESDHPAGSRQGLSPPSLGRKGLVPLSLTFFAGQRGARPAESLGVCAVLRGLQKRHLPPLLGVATAQGFLRPQGCPPSQTECSAVTGH